MECTIPSMSGLSDVALVAEVSRLVGWERRATAELIASLAEFDSRRLYLQAGCSSLFTYCTQVLHLSEHAAYGRIEAARTARRFPVILQQLADGSITLTTACLLGPLLTADNCEALLGAARHKSKREVEHLVASLRPQPAVTSSVRKLPDHKASPVVGMQRVTEAGLADAQAISSRSPTASAQALPILAPDLIASAQAPPRPAEVCPLAPERYKLQITMSRETHDNLRRAQALLHESCATGGRSRRWEPGSARARDQARDSQEPVGTGVWFPEVLHFHGREMVHTFSMSPLREAGAVSCA